MRQVFTPREPDMTMHGTNMSSTICAPGGARRALVLAGVLGLVVALPGAALAQEGFDGEGSGTATVTFDGDGGEAAIEVNWEGLAAEIPDLSGTEYEALSNMPFPHAQHIHAGGEGVCPTPEADADGDGIVNTPEGGPAYGPVVTSLTEEPGETGPAQTLDVGNFPAGDSASYSRTIDLGVDVETDAGTVNPAELVRAELGVIVVHGLDPAIMPGETALSDSAISDDLPLAATAPALCGPLVDTGDGTFTAQLSPTNPIAQVDAMPEDGVAAGGGSTAATGQPIGALALAAGLLALAATGVTVAGRRSNS